MSVELYNQHAAISELQITEDETNDQMKILCEFTAKFQPEMMDICRMPNDIDYDKDGELTSLDYYSYSWSL